MNYKLLDKKKNQLDTLRPLSETIVKNLDEWFRVELTYTSNAIEGNTLTRKETAIILEKGLAVGGKSLVEHLEATNHAKALDFVHTLLQKTPNQITEKDILTIHSIILQGIDQHNAGHYRNVPVRISGSRVVMPNHMKIPYLMANFIKWLQSENNLHPVQFAGEAHYKLVTIHPFSDGNGRTARMLMNLILMMQGYPTAIIRPTERLAYITSLENAQLGGLKEAYEKIICKAAERSLDIYLKAALGKKSLDLQPSETLLKIGEVAKATNETVATIRFWTQEGLLEIADITASRYHLYDLETIKQCNKIQRLKQKKLTLAEIKNRLL